MRIRRRKGRIKMIKKLSRRKNRIRRRRMEIKCENENEEKKHCVKRRRRKELRKKRKNGE